MPIVPSGSTNLAAVGIPNVLVQIVPPNPLLNGVPTDIIGVVGTATWGPVNSPATIGSLQELASLFGNPQAATYDLGTQVYTAIQQGANDFKCVRVTDGTDVAASVNLLDEDSDIAAVLTSKYTGTLPNSNLNAIMGAGSNSTVSAPTYKLTVFFNGGVPEVFDNIGGVGSDFWGSLTNAVNLGQSNLRGPSQIVVASSNTGISGVSIQNQGIYASIPSFAATIGSGATFASTLAVNSAQSALNAEGGGYVVGDVLTLSGGTHSVSATITVATTQVNLASINAAGTLYTAGDILTLVGGTHSVAATISVDTVNGGGGVTAITIVNHGVYTVNPGSFTVTGGTGSGMTGTATNGIRTFTVSEDGAYTVLPANPITLTGGTGTGAFLNAYWEIDSISATAPGSGYTSASVLNITGGGVLVPAVATLDLGDDDAPMLDSYVFAGGANGNAGVTDATLIGSDVFPRTGMYALRSSGASIGVLADQTDPSYWTNQVTFGLNEQIYMVTPLANLYYNDIDGALTAKLAAAVDSYALKILQGDWDLIFDPFNQVNRFVSPQGFVAGVLATQLPSGSSLNKIMNGIVASAKSSLNQVYSDADLLTLQSSGIDVVTNQLPVSPTTGVFGDRLGINCSSNIVINGDNYPRMINFLAATFNTGVGQFIGLPQTPDIQREARNTLQSFLQNLEDLGMIGTIDGSPAFRVTLDSSNNPPNRVALGFMQADVQVTLFSIIQRFVINLQAGQSVQIQVLPVQLAA